jgi:hypothetical protein
MKPDWKDAPEWAKWLAMDEDGQWHWFDIEPALGHKMWYPVGGCDETAELEDWNLSLEHRPVKE